MVLVPPAKQALKPLSLAAADQGDPGVGREAGQWGVREAGGWLAGQFLTHDFPAGCQPTGLPGRRGGDGIARAAVPPTSAMWDCFFEGARYLCLFTPHPPCTCHHHPRNPGPLLGLLPPSLSAITHLGCCSRWSWCPREGVGVDRGTGRGPGLRSSP